jgi:hypothetical protein
VRPSYMDRVYMGLSEALGPAFLNFGFLAVAWLLVAVGMARRPEQLWALRVGIWELGVGS